MIKLNPLYVKVEKYYRKYSLQSVRIKNIFLRKTAISVIKRILALPLVFFLLRLRLECLDSR